MEKELLNESWNELLNQRKKERIVAFRKQPVKIEKNSYLERFEAKSYMDLRVGIPHGTSYFVGNGRNILGAGNNSKIK